MKRNTKSTLKRNTKSASGLSVASGISSVATLSTFIGLPVSIPLGAVSLAGSSVIVV